ncbi:MAG: GIY-YIG nuclease family protein [Candidatus Doudnabacteria bacterium]|nr:GIY-YIG nuclease family protein [Candidatus Doudnabacteria bacterium]
MARPLLERLVHALNPNVVSSSGPKNMTFWYVYTLLSLRDGQFYHGFSSDPFAREKAHNRHENPSTAKRGPFELIHFEAFVSKADALRRERYFKTTKGKVTLRQMLREYLNHKNSKQQDNKKDES